MSLEPGSHLGPYEVVGRLGVGGMGEVYRARDTRLDRTVAIKVLPTHLSAQPENRERFEREARAVASLKHPNICTLHDIGEQQDVRFLVLELLEGESLADRLSRGPLPLPDAVRYGLEIADALDQAHRQGVVHRDLKPGNIMITASGSKLLDFGLAKVRGLVPTQGLSGASQFPTQETNLTAQGTILGTLQYMAPEQLEGREADARTDIFALGVVLYEMITGRRAFEGKSQVSLIAAILEHEPAPLRSLQPQAPASLEHVLARCLAKDPEQRWQSARDVAHALRWATASSAAGPATADVRRPGRRSQLMAWALAAVSLVTTAAIIGAWLLEPEVPRPTVRFEVHPPPGTDFPGGTQPRMMVSPDGTMVAFSATTADVGRSQLWVRRLDAVAAMPLPGTEGGYGLFWSPDSRFIGFFAGRSLKTIDVSGGPPATIGDVLGGAVTGPHGTWNNAGDILFSSALSGGIHRVSAAGGVPVRLTVAKEPRAHLWPQFLPDGRRFLYLDTGATPEDRGIVIGSLDSTDLKRVLRSEYNAEFAQPGYLFFVRDRTLFAQSFDHAALELQGEPVRVAEGLSVFQGRRRAAFSVSNAGTLVLRLGGPDGQGSELEFHTFDRTGKLLFRAASASAWRGFDLSPDGTHIAGHRHDDQGGDVWITDVEGQSNSRLTFDASQHQVSPIWSPDGSDIAFGSLRNGSYGIYRKAANGVGADELLFESKQLALPMDWSADGASIIFGMVSAQTSSDLWRLPLTGDRTPVPFLQTPAAEMHAQLSPDGRWLVYASNDTGRAEIFVQSYPTPGTKYQVSTSGGMFPRWRDDGKEILFMAVGRIIMSALVRVSGQGLAIDTPQRLFDSEYVNFNHSETGGGIYHPFAVSRDGQRIIVPLQRDEDREPEATSPLIVVLNWAAAMSNLRK